MKAARFKLKETSKGWQVNIPGSLSPSGKRSRRYFPSRSQAEAFASRLRIQFVQHGTGLRILAPAHADAAVRAFATLEEFSDAPEILLEAANEYADRHRSRSASIPFEDAFEQFSHAQLRSPSYRRSLRSFQTRLTSLHDRLLCDITAKDIETAMEDFSPSTFNYGFRILKALFNWGRKRDLCAGNPIEKLDYKKLVPREVEIYTPAEVAALLGNSTPALVPWLATCMFAGLRASEARKVTWSDFDFVENFVRVRAAITKTHRPRAIPLEANLREWLLPYKHEDSALIAPQGENVLRVQLRAAHQASKVRLISHGPRHSYASYLLARDGSIDRLLLNMGHTNAVVTFRHYHRVASERAAKLFWNIRPPSEAGKIVAMPA
jgi:integrase